MKNKPTAEHKRYWAWIASHRCLVCSSEASIHHIIEDGTHKRLTKDHWLVVPLCRAHHQDKNGYHMLYGRDEFNQRIPKNKLFFDMYEIDLYKEAINYLAEYESMK